MFAAPFANLPFLADSGNPLFLFGLLAIVWIVIIVLPMRKEKKRKAEMMANLKKGDRLVFQNGLIGKLVSDKGQTLVAESNGSKFEILKDQVVRILDDKSES